MRQGLIAKIVAAEDFIIDGYSWQLVVHYHFISYFCRRPGHHNHLQNHSIRHLRRHRRILAFVVTMDSIAAGIVVVTSASRLVRYFELLYPMPRTAARLAPPSNRQYRYLTPPCCLGRPCQPQIYSYFIASLISSFRALPKLLAVQFVSIVI